MNKLLVIGTVWPEPKSSAAGSRMIQLLKMFIEFQYEITFATTAKKTDRSFDLTSLGIKTQFIYLNSSSFDDFIVSLNPSIVMFDRYMTEEQFGGRVVARCSKAVRILDTEDLHSLRAFRELCYNKNEDFSIEGYNKNSITHREIASIYRCDLTLIISEFEMNFLIQDLKIPKKMLFYLPFLIQEKTIPSLEELNSFSKRKHFVTIGNFFHNPNVKSLYYLKKNIWPEIRKELKDVEFHAYGAYSQKEKLQLENIRNGFYIKGSVEDSIETILNYRICLAPLPFGAGLKGKFIDAMLAGTPIITNSVGAEGMTLEQNWNGFITDETKDMVAKSIYLYKNEHNFMKFQSIGIRILRNKFQFSDFVKVFYDALEQLMNNLDQERGANLISNILFSSGMKSTYYMTKWIEEKNKNVKN